MNRVIMMLIAVFALSVCTNTVVLADDAAETGKKVSSAEKKVDKLITFNKEIADIIKEGYESDTPVGEYRKALKEKLEAKRDGLIKNLSPQEKKKIIESLEEKIEGLESRIDIYYSVPIRLRDPRNLENWLNKLQKLKRLRYQIAPELEEEDRKKAEEDRKKAEKERKKAEEEAKETAEKIKKNEEKITKGLIKAIESVKKTLPELGF